MITTKGKWIGSGNMKGHQKIQMVDGLIYLFQGSEEIAKMATTWQYIDQDQFCHPVKTNEPIVESEFYQKLFNEAHDIGINRAISFCDSQKQIYAAIDPTSPVPMVIDSIIKTLHHFKKS